MSGNWSVGATRTLLRRLLVVADVAAVILGLAASMFLRPNGSLASGHLSLALISLPVWALALAGCGLYRPIVAGRPGQEGRRLAKAALASVGAMLAMAAAVQFDDLSRGWLLSTLVAVPAAVLAVRFALRRVLESRPGGVQRALVIGTDPEAIALVHAAQRHPELGILPVGFVGPDDLGSRGGCDWLGGFDGVEDVMRRTGATGAVISLASVPPELVNQLVRRLPDAGFIVSLAPGMRDIDARRCTAWDLDGRALIEVRPTHRGGWRAGVKRAFDVSVATIALALSLPLSMIVAAAVKLTSPGPILFAQERVGRDGRRFQIYKFRTMVADAEARKASLADANEADGPMFKMARDPRVTRVGAILRKLSIDEIPQFVNVLRGDMSVVGPRPALASEVEQWSAEVHERLRVLPGITGMWQVSGRSDTSFDEYKRLDLYYVDNWTLAHDLRIVARTVPAVLAKRGAH